jgi:hypothetical protein
MKFQSGPGSQVLLNPGTIAAIMAGDEDIGHVLRRSAVSPMRIACIAGVGEKLLVVAGGDTLAVFSLETYEQLASIEVPQAPMQLAVCPYDPNLVAYASLQHVMVFNVSYGIHVTHEIELMLDSLGQDIFVNAVEWVPLAPLHLAVLCNVFVKIYEIPTDCFAPLSCFCPDDKDFITSGLFAVDANDTVYGLFAASSNRIALQATAIQDFDGPLPLTNYLRSNIPVPVMATISCCPEHDLFFVTASGSSMSICRLSQALTGECTLISISLPVCAPWSFVSFCNTVHYFVNPLTGAVMSLEFTDACLEASIIGNPESVGNLLLLESRMAYFK